MKKEITLLIGLPGSGKSYWLKQLIANKENNHYAVFDDISQTDQTLKNLEKNLLSDSISEIYIADVNFLQENVIELAIEKIKKFIDANEINNNINKKLTSTILIVKKIIFIGDEETCKKNVSFRNDGRNVDGTIKRFKNSVEKIRDKYENTENTILVKVLDYSQNKKLPKMK